MLYDRTDAIETLSVWNESDYGCTYPPQHTSWWQPLYRTLGEAAATAPSVWERF